MLLGQALPGRQLYGVDLAAGMVALAEQKLAAAGLRCAGGTRLALERALFMPCQAPVKPRGFKHTPHCSASRKVVAQRACGAGGG